MKIRRLLRHAVSALMIGVSLASHATQSLTISIVPQFPPEEIYRAWNPVLNEIFKITGLRLALKSYASIPDFEAAFLAGEPDIAYLNPYHMVMAKKAAGYTPIIRDDHQRLSGILVVRKDSPITSVAQLEGSTLAFPSPNAFGASLYMRALLTEEAKVRFTTRYVKTHSNVYRHVINGHVQAGGAVRHTLDKESPQVQDQLRILFESPAVFAHPIAVHPRVSAKMRGALQQVFLSLGARPEFQTMLKDIQIPTPAKATYSEYAPLEKLGLDKYVVLKED